MESGDELATILVYAIYAVGPVRLFRSHDVYRQSTRKVYQKGIRRGYE